MKPVAVTLRTTLLLTIGALSAIIVALAGGLLLEDAHRLAAIRRLEATVVLNDKISNTAAAIALTRDITMSALAARDSRTIEELRPRLVEARSLSDAEWREAVTLLARDDDPTLAALGNRLSESHRVVLQLRRQIDAQLASPERTRDNAVVARWNDRITLALADAQSLWEYSSARLVGIDSIATLHMRYQTSLRIIRDLAGTERAMIGQLVARGTPPSPAEAAALLRTQGAIDLAWKVNRSAAVQSRLYDKIAPAYSDAVSHDATLRAMLQGTFYGPHQNSSPPLGPDLWFELSTQAAESLDGLDLASKRASHDYLEALVTGTQQRMTSRAILCVFCLSLCALSLWVILARVISPIEQIVRALERATRGEPSTFRPRRYADEIGKLAAVLDAFQQSLERTRQAAADLKRSENYLQAVVGQARDGLLTIDARGIVLSFNTACEGIFGYAAAEIVGRPARVLIPDRAEHDLAFSDSIFRDEEMALVVPSGEFTARTKDGANLPIEVSVNAFAVDDKVHRSAIIRDLTKRKQAEHDVLIYTRALERSNKELDDFAYIASHDLKEPLRGIHNHARFLLEDHGDALGEDSAKRLNRLVYLSQRMERLVNDLLYFSRLGRQELAVQATDVGALISDVAGTLDHFLEERGAQIVVPEPLPTIICDKPRVGEVFRNLITNAAKYNDKAEKLIEIGFRAVQALPDGAEARNVFYVRDNGHGVDPEFHHEIFRIFKRLQASEGAQDGTGVGLTFVKKIVERHGGRIWLESARGTGSTFFFTLEAIADASSVTAQAA